MKEKQWAECPHDNSMGSVQPPNRTENVHDNSIVAVQTPNRTENVQDNSMGSAQSPNTAEHVYDNSTVAVVSTDQAERICDVFRMLSEPSRLKIVLALLGGELCVCHILQSVGGTQSALSHQLRILKDNRVLRARREGQNVYYSLADEHVRQMVAVGLKHSDCGGEI